MYTKGIADVASVRLTLSNVKLSCTGLPLSDCDVAPLSPTWVERTIEATEVPLLILQMNKINILVLTFR